jgi:ribulose-5-phosphate 4-epimerase/fuculose-1-phosphate aldolase
MPSDALTAPSDDKLHNGTHETAPGDKDRKAISQSRATEDDLADAFNPKTYVPGSYKYSRQYIRERLSRSILHEFSIDEQKVRIELAAAYRLAAKNGWLESIYNHITCNVAGPNGAHHFLINPFGLSYREITASSLVKIDLDGNTIHPGVVGDIMGVNRAGFVIHSCIHRARPDVKCVNHNHNWAVAGLSATKSGVVELAQTTHVTGEIAYHDYEGIAISMDEQERIVRDLGDKDVMILRNHGLLTCGPSVAAAYSHAYTLCAAAEMQSHACSMAFNKDDLLIPEERLIKLSMDIAKNFNQTPLGSLEFAAAMRELDYDQDHSSYPDYRN